MPWICIFWFGQLLDLDLHHLVSVDIDSNLIILLVSLCHRKLSAISSSLHNNFWKFLQLHG